MLTVQVACSVLCRCFGRNVFAGCFLLETNDYNSPEFQQDIYVGNVLYPVRVLGPGQRIGIWLVGCSRGCKGCVSPEFRRRESRFRMPVRQLLSYISDLTEGRTVDGITISGGEPFEQPEALRVLLPELEKITPDILIYTGFLKSRLESSGYSDILSKTGVLIDGPYVEERNTGVFLRGSDNQNIYILKPELNELYAEYMKDGTNRLQLFRTSTGFVSVGIVRRGFTDELGKHLFKNGVNLSSGGRKDEDLN